MKIYKFYNARKVRLFLREYKWEIACSGTVLALLGARLVGLI